jgi:hypothetical protein
MKNLFKKVAVALGIIATTVSYPLDLGIGIQYNSKKVDPMVRVSQGFKTGKARVAFGIEKILGSYPTLQAGVIYSLSDKFSLTALEKVGVGGDTLQPKSSLSSLSLGYSRDIEKGKFNFSIGASAFTPIPQGYFSYSGSLLTSYKLGNVSTSATCFIPISNIKKPIVQGMVTYSFQ